MNFSTFSACNGSFRAKKNNNDGRSGNKKEWVEREHQTSSCSYSGRSLKIVLKKSFLGSFSDYLS